MTKLALAELVRRLEDPIAFGLPRNDRGWHLCLTIGPGGVTQESSLRGLQRKGYDVAPAVNGDPFAFRAYATHWHGRTAHLALCEDDEPGRTTIEVNGRIVSARDTRPDVERLSAYGAYFFEHVRPGEAVSVIDTSGKLQYRYVHRAIRRGETDVDYWNSFAKDLPGDKDALFEINGTFLPGPEWRTQAQKEVVAMIELGRDLARARPDVNPRYAW